MNVTRVAVLLVTSSAATASAQQTGWSAHGDARLFIGYYDQNTRAGSRGLTTSTWVMGGVQHTTSKRAITAHAMLSGDAPLNGECGQPRLLPQTFHCGDGAARSHPLFMQLGATTSFVFQELSVSFAAAVAGEPAFGPVPHFMRASARLDAGEPLTHHYFNPAHSAPGLVSAKIARAGLSLELSAFHPQQIEDAYHIDVGPLDAAAVRLAFARSPRFALQLSAAYFPALESGSHHGPGGDMRAYSLTASGTVGQLDYTVGCAAHRTAQHTPGACLAEGTLALGSHLLFARVEGVDRLEQTTVAVIMPDGSHVHTLNHHMMQTGEIAAGYGLLLPARLGWQPAVGVRAALTAIPDYFRQRYLEQNGAVFLLFASLRPARQISHAH